MSSLFDPTVMLNVEVDAPMDTKVVQPPKGRYNFQILDVALKQFEGKDGKPPSHRIELKCEADANQLSPTGEKVAELIGRERFTARYSGWADLTPQMTWELGNGKNVALGAIREAVGMNTPGVSFRLPMLKGQMFSGELTWRYGENQEDIYLEIKNPLPRQ